MAEARIGFLVGGVQKAGTSALARYLSAHPGIALPVRKEAHVFDAANFDDRWTTAEVDARFASRWAAPADARLCGDATPLTVFHRLLVARVARYNPAMRWVLLLRDPVERAISHYFMERARGAEPLPLARAILAERGRLRGHQDDFSRASPLRTWSYTARGRYARQLDGLLAHFPRQQVLLLRSSDLAADPAAVTGRVLAFLGLPGFDRPPRFARVFEGNYPRPGALAPGRLLLRLLLRGELAALKARHGLDLQR